MARKAKVLRALVNPFCILDHDGRPACAVAFEPNPKARGTELRRHHGAVLKAALLEERKATQIIGKVVIPGDPRPSLHDRTFQFAFGEVITVPDTKFYREHFTPAVGQVSTPFLPADEETARKLGRPFRDPELSIVETAHIMAKKWSDANDGEVAEFMSIDLDSEASLADVHPLHVASARYLAKLLPKKVAEVEKSAQTKKADEAKRTDVRAKVAASLAAAKTEEPPKGPSVLEHVEASPAPAADTTVSPGPTAPIEGSS